MHDDPRTLRSIDFRAVFPVLNLFRAFRIAIHPPKLLLALAMVLLLYGVGRTMDAMWLRDFSYSEQRMPLMTLPASAGVDAGRATSGPFDVLLKYQLTQLHFLSQGVLRFDIAEVLGAIYNFIFVGPGWGFSHHPFYSLGFGAFILLSFALFGGAIARIAAVNIARGENLTFRNALRFSTGKLLSFVAAPIILALFIGVLGLVIAVLGLLFYIPFAGPIVLGAGFVVILAIGFVMTLAVFGALGGFSLMYPTIAVEGTDAFDAISRSFSYCFAKPWRLALYCLIAVFYGVFSYLFLKLFLFVMFVLIQAFQTWFLASGTLAAPGAADNFKLFFPPPDFESFSYGLSATAIDSRIGTGGVIGARLLAGWFYLIVALLGAFAVSFYFSASTLVYMLMRRDIDTTELDEVYLEDSDDDTLPDPLAPTTAATPATPAIPASPNPAATPEAGTDKPGDDDQPPTFSASPLT
jgi:hypothetical protein